MESTSPLPADADPVSCPIARPCGGCALIGTDYSSQLQAKTARVRSAVSAFHELKAVEVAACHPAPQTTGYRNRAKLAVAEIDGQVRIGLYERGSNRVVDLAPCRVQRPVVAATVEGVRDWLSRHGLAAPAGPVIYIDVREAAENTAHVTLVVDAAKHEQVPKLPYDGLIEKTPSVTGIAVNFGHARSSYPIGEKTSAVLGPPSFDAPLRVDDGRTVGFEVPATGFFQVATDALAHVHARMREHLGADGTLYDLYCGVGVHGLMITLGHTPADQPLIGIENVPAAAAAAARNARRLGVEAQYLAGRVEDRLTGALAAGSATRVVLNPGRAGCRAGVLNALAGARAARVAYLSCNPDTLARDLAVLAERGFRVRTIQPLDFMPQTDQVEALALLEGRS